LINIDVISQPKSEDVGGDGGRNVTVNVFVVVMMGTEKKNCASHNE
jgi:hypothetical protein